MTVRGQFTNELYGLKKEIMILGTMVEKALCDTMNAIKRKQYSKFDEIIENDIQVNQIELEINEKATLMIAKQQPVASDLRKIIVSLKVSSDLERVGDLTVDIAKAASRLKDHQHMVPFENELLTMGEKAQRMLQESLKAYQESNVLAAQHIATMDDEVDEAYGLFVRNIFGVVVSEKGVTEQVTQMAYISRYIERIADYCTNIAEWIIYEVNGKRFDLN
ncbi:phosphate signaling complex protein PhoU [Evansella halocellulosilytica]|uniref:phosphate signaling complex protein PhoU n=1 Tax=Evansella halocellulosilytica TaxID=2011013 RepID=UPI000BB70805|nr:phosphate signaling complex protein PhoU [Evansella halocellulosilytica]